MTSGIQQGLVLGPKLFILYLNDICTVSNKLKFVMFADYTNLFCSEFRIIENSRKGIDSVKKKWLDINKLSLSENKTKFMVFDGVRVNCEIKLNFNGV